MPGERRRQGQARKLRLASTRGKTNDRIGRSASDPVVQAQSGSVVVRGLPLVHADDVDDALKVVNGGWYRYQWNVDAAAGTMTAYVTGLDEGKPWRLKRTGWSSCVAGSGRRAAVEASTSLGAG